MFNNIGDWRFITGVRVSGLLTDAGWQVFVLLLLLGYQGEGSFVFPKEEEESNSFNTETKCKKERRVFEDKNCSNCWEVSPGSLWGRDKISWKSLDCAPSPSLAGSIFGEAQGDHCVGGRRRCPRSASWMGLLLLLRRSPGRRWPRAASSAQNQEWNPGRLVMSEMSQHSKVTCPGCFVKATEVDGCEECNRGLDFRTGKRDKAHPNLKCRSCQWTQILSLYQFSLHHL